MAARPPLIDSWPAHTEAKPKAEAEGQAKAAEAPEAEVAPAFEAADAKAEAAATAEAADAEAEATGAADAEAQATDAADAEAADTAEAQHPPTWSRGPLSPELVQFFEEACVGPHDKQQGTVGHSSTGELLPFRTADLRTLRPETWVCNYVINNYFHLVVTLHKHWPNLPRCRILKEIEIGKYFIDPHFEPLGDLKRWFLRDKTLFDLEMIFIPIHLPAHWVMVVLDIEHQRLQYYDSLPCCQKDFAGMVMDKIQQWALAECKATHRQNTPAAKTLLGAGLGSWPCEVVPLHNQEDSHSCGVYVCQTALMLALRLSPQQCNMVDADANVFRQKIGMSLLAGRVVF